MRRLYAHKYFAGPSATRGEWRKNMEILRSNIDSANKYDVYRMTKSSGEMVQNIVDGLSVPVSKWALYTDVKEGRDGTKEQQVLSIVDNSGVKYSTVSATFVREFLDIVDIMDGDAFAVIIRHGQTKSGKNFVTCELDCDYRG